MKQKRRLFVVSDIHGHYTLLRKALKDAGFQEENCQHLLVCCGDVFDRGEENRKVFQYLNRLKNKVLIMGNHDERMVEMLHERKVTGIDLKNGKGKTFVEFFGPDCMRQQGQLTLPKDGKMAGHLLEFLGQMRDYYETEHYIFTHGWLPLEQGIHVSRVREDWREADSQAWHNARWEEWHVLYNAPSRVPGKTIVCGHRTCSYGSFFDPNRRRSDASIFYGDGVIAIDACTVISGQVNVLVLDEEIESE